MHLREPHVQIDSKWSCYNYESLYVYEPQKVVFSLSQSSNKSVLIDILMGYSIVLMNQFVWAYINILRRLTIFFYFYKNNFMADVCLIVRSDV